MEVRAASCYYGSA